MSLGDRLVGLAVARAMSDLGQVPARAPAPARAIALRFVALGITLLGFFVSLELMGDAAMLIFSSEWNETFGRTMVEAYARATPVLAARIGAAADIVRRGLEIAGDICIYSNLNITVLELDT